MKQTIKFLLYTLFILLFFSGKLVASQIEMADFLRESGKIYVVVSCIVIIFIGFLTFLFYLDKKLKTLENKIENNKNKEKI